MDAQFRVGEVHVEVKNGGPGVLVAIITGFSGDSSGVTQRHVERELYLSKADARAVASAIMGAAAEAS